MPTYETNPRHPRYPVADLAASRQQNGFSLIELLVVFAIIGLILAIAPVAYGKLNEATEYSATLRRVVTELRQSRQQAFESGRSVKFQLNLQDKSFGRDGNLTTKLPPTLQVTVTVASKLVIDQSLVAIEFLPAGGATGGTIEIKRPSGAGARVKVDWLSGSVSVESFPS